MQSIKLVPPLGRGDLLEIPFLKILCGMVTIQSKWAVSLPFCTKPGLCGYSYIVIGDAKFEHIRPLGKTYKFYEFGASMRTLGYHPVFALGRFLDCLMVGGSMGRTGAFYMLYYYLTYKPQHGGYNGMFHETLRSYVRAKQLKRLKRIRIISKFNAGKYSRSDPS